jgi:hypothetical protein
MLVALWSMFPRYGLYHSLGQRFLRIADWVWEKTGAKARFLDPRRLEKLESMDELVGRRVNGGLTTRTTTATSVSASTASGVDERRGKGKKRRDEERVRDEERGEAIEMDEMDPFSLGAVAQAERGERRLFGETGWRRLD